MASSAKQLVITLLLIGLMAGLLYAESIDGETLNRQEQENVLTNSRRLLHPRLHNIYHPVPLEPASPKENYAPPEPASPKQNYALPEPASPIMQNYAPPASPAPRATRATQLNQDDIKTVDCGDRQCAGIWIGRRFFVVKYD